MCVGIPFPYLVDEGIMAKKAFQDWSHNENDKQLSGNCWYRLQAFCALNQALGRVIRHRHDYGVLILVDSRLGESSNLLCWITKWLRDHLRFARSGDLPTLGRVIHNFFASPALKRIDDLRAGRAEPVPVQIAYGGPQNPEIAVEHVPQESGDDEDVSPRVINLIDSDSDDDEDDGTVDSDVMFMGQESADVIAPENLNDVASVELKPNQQPDDACNDAGGIDSAAVVPDKHNADDGDSSAISDDNECIVCLERGRSVAFIPCGHYRCCEVCANSIMTSTKSCPCCRRDIDEIYRIFA